MAIGLPSAAWTPLPSTRTFAQLKKEVARFVNSPSDEEVLEAAGDGLNSGIRWLNLMSWWWAVQTQDITLVASDADYTLNTLFRAPRHMELLDSSGLPRRQIGYVDSKSFKITYPNRESTGTPVAYTVQNHFRDGLVQFDVPPASAFVTTYPTARLHYYKQVALLVEDAEQPGVPSFVERYLTWEAKEYVAGIHDPEKIPYASAKVQQAKQELIRENTLYSEHDWHEGDYR